MSLIRPKAESLKTHKIAGKDYYSIRDAARRLEFSRSKLADGLLSGRFPFEWAKLGDSETSPIYVSAKDVEVYVRERDRQFEIRLKQNARYFNKTNLKPTHLPPFPFVRSQF
jgi:hypothetical protein